MSQRRYHLFNVKVFVTNSNVYSIFWVRFITGRHLREITWMRRWLEVRLEWRETSLRRGCRPPTQTSRLHSCQGTGRCSTRVSMWYVVDRWKCMISAHSDMGLIKSINKLKDRSSCPKISKIYESAIGWIPLPLPQCSDWLLFLSKIVQNLNKTHTQIVFSRLFALMFFQNVSPSRVGKQFTWH